MRTRKLVVFLMVLAALAAGSAVYADPCGPDAPGWSCYTNIGVSGNTTTCTATAVSPGGSYNISLVGGGPGGKALHLGTTYYGSNGTCNKFSTSCSVTFTYTGSARPNLCNWKFKYF